MTTIHNFRPIAGHATRDGGRVREGLLYRSGDLSRAGGEDAAAIAALGLATVYDLRSSHERERAPDRLPDRSVAVAVDLIRDAAGPNPADLFLVFEDPERAKEAFGGDRTGAFWRNAYTGFVQLASAREGLGRVLRGLGGEDQLPALIHCTTGKDRTGWAVAVLLERLGVPRATIVDDYLRSNAIVEVLLPEFAAALVARGGDPELLRGFLGVEAAYLGAAFTAMETAYGDIEGYLADGLGIEGALQDRLVARFVEPASVVR